MNQSFILSELMINDVTLILVGTSKSIVFLGRKEHCESYFKQWQKKYFPTYTLVTNSDAFTIEKEEIIEYYAGKRESFTFSYHLIGTDFQKLVWQALQNTCYGTTCSYTDIAKQIGKENSVRAVASAIGKNPLMIVVPCHRVLRKDGGIGGFRGGLDMKKALLKIEKTTSFL